MDGTCLKDRIYLIYASILFLCTYIIRFGRERKSMIYLKSLLCSSPNLATLQVTPSLHILHYIFFFPLQKNLNIRIIIIIIQTINFTRLVTLHDPPVNMKGGKGGGMKIVLENVLMTDKVSTFFRQSLSRGLKIITLWDRK